MFALFIKEISSFFSSIIGYIVITIFLLITSLFLWVFPIESNILDFGYAQLNGLFMIAPYVFLFLIPAISMRSFADENKSGTIELLLTKPISDLNIIIAKFSAAFVLLLIAIIPTLAYYFSVYQLGYPVGNIDSGGVFGSYIGLLLLGASFISIGLFSSSITSNQIVAFIISVVLSGFLFLGFEFIFNLSLFGDAGLLIKTLGIYDHYTSISRGVLDTRDIIYFISIIALFLFLTRFSLQSRKW
jgi:ABC-2 type transport system permease protein